MRLRMKAYLGSIDGVLGPFMVQAAGYMPGNDKLAVFMMNEDHTVQRVMTTDEYNALDFYWFEMKEQASRPARKWNNEKGSVPVD